MAKAIKKKSPEAQEAEDEVLHPEEQRELEDAIDESQTLDDFRAQFSGKAYRVRIEKQNPASKEFEMCEQISFDNFDPFVIRDSWGPGKYRASLLNDRGRYVSGGRMHYVFAAPVERPKEETKVQDPLQNPLFGLMMKSMEAQNAQLLKIMEIQAQGRPAENPMDPMKLLTMIQTLKGMTEPPKGINDMKDMLTTFKAFKDLTGGNDGGEGSWADDIKTVVEMMGQIKGVAPLQRPQIAPRPTVSGQPTPLTVVPAKSAEGEKSMTEAEQKAIFYAPKFVDAAKENASVDVWAEFLLDIIDREIVPAIKRQYGFFATEDRIYDSLLDAARSPEQIAKIYDYVPTLKDYGTWVDAVIGAAVKLFTEDDADSDPREETASMTVVDAEPKVP